MNSKRFVAVNRPVKNPVCESLITLFDSCVSISQTIDSKNLPIVGRIAIPRYISTFDLDPDLNIGVMLEIFHLAGKIPLFNDKLKSKSD